MKNNLFEKLTSFLQNLEQQKIAYTLAHHRDEAIMVSVALPGERWEIEFLNDGSIEVEKFISNGDIATEEALDDLFTRYLEPEDLAVESSQSSEMVTVKI